ncbi:hypothetical protein Tco_1046239, partial [Tanacetum coccineum]
MHDHNHHASKRIEHPINSDDHFEIYKILEKNKDKGGLEKNKGNGEVESTEPQFPPGFTHDVEQENADEANPAVGYSGGILCVWDLSLVLKDNSTISDSFVAIRGRSNEDLVSKRTNLLKELHDLNSNASLDMIQKAKIRWGIEGDENSKYFHGIINKKRSQLAIRGVLVEGDWIFLNTLSLEQFSDIKRDVTYDEIKNAVWDCGTTKSPGPDGFTFEFFRRYWKTIDDDVLAAVLQFFS